VTRAERAAVRRFARALAARVAAVHEAQRREALERKGAGAEPRRSVLPASTVAGVARWRAAVPAGPRAHKRVYDAVRAGRLERPDKCEGCGLEKRLHAHHDDYSRPLRVRWLCGSCHRLAHRALDSRSAPGAGGSPVCPGA
jgi:ribosomal protein S27AE